MYRVTIYKDKRLIATFLENLMSVAVGKAKERNKEGDLMYLHEVVQTADGQYEEIECVVRATI